MCDSSSTILILKSCANFCVILKATLAQFKTRSVEIVDIGPRWEVQKFFLSPNSKYGWGIERGCKNMPKSRFSGPPGKTPSTCGQIKFSAFVSAHKVWEASKFKFQYTVRFVSICRTTFSNTIAPKN